MAKKPGNNDISITQYLHEQKRTNNPQVGLVSSDLDSKPKKKAYKHDQYVEPFLSWAGKTEGDSFNVDTVSLHIHERIDPKRIIKQILKKSEQISQPSLFERPSEIFGSEKEFDFYSHTKNWSNRIIAGDSLLVMNSLLEKESMSRKIQMVYIDPPYGVKYNSNFQPYVNRREVKDNNDDDVPAEPETIKAFRDTWELGIHSYLTYLRDRLLLAKELLHESGSVVIQISDENLGRVKELTAEIFGSENFISVITVRKTSYATSNTLPPVADYLIWFAKNKALVKYRPLFTPKPLPVNDPNFKFVLLPDGTRRQMTKEERSNPTLLPDGSRIYRLSDITSAGASGYDDSFTFKGKIYRPGSRHHWKTSLEGMKVLAESDRIAESGSSIAFVKYFDDFSYQWLDNIWDDTSTGGFGDDKIYVVQTTQKTVQRCILMMTDPGDLVLDITCGSGTTAYVAEQWGRRWITCDTSRVAVQLAKQRLMTAKFENYELAQPHEGISSGFKYKTAAHITLGSIANKEIPTQETLIDQPNILKNAVRVTGPFTVEAVPGVRTKPIDGSLPDISDPSNPSNLVSEQISDYLDCIRSSGIRSYHNEGITFNRVEIADGLREIHAFGEIISAEGSKKCAIVFGPDYAPMEQTKIERALDEVRTLAEKPNLVVFCSYSFDPEASKDIDNVKIPNLQILKAQMNTDLLTKDLKKRINTNKPFWLVGEPDIEVRQVEKGKYVVEVKGFDYYDPRTQELKGGSIDKIAVWMLDTDYDNRSLFPSQIFFPMKDHNRDWTKLAKSLNGSVDNELLEKYVSTISLPFAVGDRRLIAVKIVDDRGIEMLIVKKIQ